MIGPLTYSFYKLELSTLSKVEKMFSWETGRPELVSEAWKEILGSIKSSLTKKQHQTLLQKGITSLSKIKHKMHVEKNSNFRQKK